MTPLHRRYIGNVSLSVYPYRSIIFLPLVISQSGPVLDTTIVFLLMHCLCRVTACHYFQILPTAESVRQENVLIALCTRVLS